jgi:hypothetical protein
MLGFYEKLPNTGMQEIEMVGSWFKVSLGQKIKLHTRYK